jgi:N-acetyl-1-D-myo-inositol-2-amino-2-deoxy-alpha-D-glucopyranoside deacetylase
MGIGRLLAVHAHPDDETLATGGTLARYAASGASVTLVTCTLGQAGEVIPDELRHLTGARLGRWRRTELARAAHELGVTDHRLLGEGRWVDSGMVWLEPGIAGPSPDCGPDAFALAPVEGAAGLLAAIIREVRPQVVLTYDPEWGYGHPDHIQAHRVTTRAVDLAAVPSNPDDSAAGGDGWIVPRICWARVTRSWALAERTRSAKGAPASMVARDAHAPFPPAVVDDGLVDVALDVRAVMDRTAAALRAHATQVRVEGDWFALSDDVAQLRRPTEWYQVATVGDRAAAVGSGPTDDLFHGLSLTD